MNNLENFDLIGAASSSAAGFGYWAQRINAELRYLLALTKARGEADDKIYAAAAKLADKVRRTGAISAADVAETEAELAGFGDEAKSYTNYFISHAHIDMNWMWGYQETSSIAIDTFRTMLTLMDEYPQFKFSQSQASVYQIVEKYEPAMVDEIKKRVHEGRWEVAASTWVESDKNMPSAESLLRHLLYTKRYLSGLLDLDPDTLRLDFEPDTFGHNQNMPEILNAGGVDRYYHCRAYDGHFIYNWEAPSGAKLLVYRDPNWYGTSIGYDILSNLPLFCREYGIDCGAIVYGVGDHGGGPTRRDIERISDMARWPLYPTVRFSTYNEFYDALEKFRDKLPNVKQELNFVFTGCYTTQTRIKLSNRIAQSRLYDAEFLNAAATTLTGAPQRNKSYETGWENTLFNQFHDILTGSGVIETREFAMGRFQDTLARADTGASAAMRAIAAHTDTSKIEVEDDRQSRSEGAGVGYGVAYGEAMNTDVTSGFGLPQTERGRGRVRILHLFNTTAYDRTEPINVVVWDYPGDLGRSVICDAATGRELPWQIISQNADFCGHGRSEILVRAAVPAYSYVTCVIKPRTGLPVVNFGLPRDRCDNNIGDNDVVLENNKVKAVFDPSTVALKSLIDKRTGEELVSSDRPSGVFRFITESTRYGMTAWRVGPYMKVETLNTCENVRLNDVNPYGMVKRLNYSVKFASSSMNVTVTLPDDSDTLTWDVQADWHEFGNDRKGIPQLNFYAPVAYKTDGCRCSIPMGYIDRCDYEHDVPVTGIMAVKRADGESVVSLLADSKYGFRCSDNSGAITLIRSSYDPDPFPELGHHHFRVGIGVGKPDTMGEKFAAFNHPVEFVSGTAHSGDLPLDGCMLGLTSANDVRLIAYKNGEDGGAVVHVYDVSGRSGKVTVSFGKSLTSACLMDIAECHKTGEAEISGDRASFELGADKVAVLAVKF